MKAMPAYYNENDPYAAQWLRNLIDRNLIAPGEVDERSILNVKPDDLRGYDQCHFFAGIGGWSYALRLAGWPDDRPVWTGSCPCQPFSAAGKQRGSDDERHLWPTWFRLIAECRPGSVFGEQVAGAAGLAWLDHVCADLEGSGYAAAAAALPACCVGAHHRRERLFWVAHADGRHPSAEWQQRRWEQRQQPQDGGTDILADSGEERFNQHTECDSAPQRRVSSETPRGADVDRRRESGILGNAGNEGLEIERRFPGVPLSASRTSAGQAIERADPLAAWSDIEWIECTDGKARPTQPGLFPLVDGLPGGGVAVGRAAAYAPAKAAGHIFSRVGVLRGAGNAIVPQVAAVFVMAGVCDDSLHLAWRKGV